VGLTRVGCLRVLGKRRMDRGGEQVEWAEKVILAQSVGGFLFFSFPIFISTFNLKYPNQIQIPIFHFQFFSSVKINTNVNITSIVSNIIIYPCYVFMGGINGFLKIPILFFSIPLFIFKF
jgi:hypothetical protein